MFHNPVLTLPLSISQFTTNENFFSKKTYSFSYDVCNFSFWIYGPDLTFFILSGIHFVNDHVVMNKTNLSCVNTFETKDCEFFEFLSVKIK